MSEELIATARRLARAHRTRPRQADLTRAVSTAYYAVFHALARHCADMLVGGGPERSDDAWTQVYRALEHGFAKNACRQVGNLGFSPDIANLPRRLRACRTSGTGPTTTPMSAIPKRRPRMS